MKIDRKLNLVLSVTRDDGVEVHVHSTPISREIYETHFLILSKAVSAMYEEGLAPGICSRVALMMMRKVADKTGDREMLEKVLLPEIWRLTNVLMPTDRGWETVPFQTVINNGMMDENDIAEVQNFLCFFTAVSWVHKKAELEAVIYPLLLASGGSTSSLNCTEYSNSLRTSTQAENTGATATPSSIPI